MPYLISISFAPIFPFPWGYLYPCYVLALLTPCSSLSLQTLSYPIAQHSVICSILFSSCQWLFDTWSLNLPHGSISSLYFSLQTCLQYLKLRPHLQVPDLRRCCPSQSSGQITILLCSFTHVGELHRVLIHALAFMQARRNRINNSFILFAFSGVLFLNSVIVIALFYCHLVIQALPTQFYLLLLLLNVILPNL